MKAEVWLIIFIRHFIFLSLCEVLSVAVLCVCLGVCVRACMHVCWCASGTDVGGVLAHMFVPSPALSFPTFRHYC